ncbi:MAG TPA: TonB-dependent receptor [Fibrobacteria bacterium]|nr:TonB-dependent receptor [Fibrobacteria bacterium]
MKLSTMILLLLIIGASGPGTAQTIQNIYSIPLDSLWNIKVTGVSRFEQSANRALNSIIVITEQQIETRGYQDLSDILKDMPGFDITDNGARFGEFYTLRGIPGNERMLILIDGHKINPPTGTLLSVGNSISVRFAKQVEIIYGPASAMYGADAFSGIINIISKDNARNNSNLISTASYGSNSTVDAMVESRTRINDDLSITVFGRVFRSDGFNPVGFDTLFNIITRHEPPLTPKGEQPIDDFSFFSRINYKDFTLGYFRQMFDEGNSNIESPLRNVYNSIAKWKISTDNIWLNHRKDFGNIGTLNSDINVDLFSIDDNSQFTKWEKPNVPGAFISQYSLGSDLAVRGNTNLHKVFSDHAQVIGGIDCEYIRSIPPYSSDQLLGQAYKFEGHVADTIREKMVSTESRIAGFGQLTWTPIYTLDLVLGGRYDYSSKYEGTFNPRLGLTYTPFTNTLIKSVYATAFQAPSLFYQYEQFGTPTHVMISSVEVRQRTDPNWQLKNQLLTSYELSITHRLMESLQLRVACFYNHLTDVIERVTIDTVPNTYNKYFDNQGIGIRNENIGVQTIKGIDAEANYGFSDKLETHFYYSYMDAIEETGGRNVEIPRVSNHKIWVGATYNNLFGYVTISPRLRWIGEMNHANRTAFPSGKQEGYTALDLSLSADEIFGFMKIHALFNNLLDEKIYHGGLYEQAGGHLAAIPQEGLRVQFGFQVRL